MTAFPNVFAFLSACASDSTKTYRAFETLLVELEQPEQRGSAIRLLHALADHVEDLKRTRAAEPALADAPRFSIERVNLPPLDGEHHTLRLLQLPSVFAPESWSFTFFEGLTRLPRSYFQDHVVAELGCGNGWISIALCRHGGVRKIYGLDINPRAILSAKLNLYLNTSDAEGNLHSDAAGQSLLERVEFHTSNLLEHCLTQKIALDRVIGCIPQVLNPDLESTLQIIPETASDEFLHSLSNYCGKQGYVEDQFGLGLMARVLEESIDVLRPSGSVVFNLGGRPGRAVLHRLFERRGFRVRELWQRRALQAADTDIHTLVNIEQRTSHRFEFYLGRHSDTPIGARTAEAYAQAGGAISHAISVYEGRLAYAAHVKAIFNLLRQDPFRAVQGAIDLAFTEDSLAEEKLSFLSALARSLAEASCFPYGDTSGEASFLRGLARYFEAYFGIPAAPANFVAAPTRSAAIRNLLTVYRPALALVDRELSHLVTEDDEIAKGISVIEAPRRADLNCQLILTLRPNLVLTALAEFEARTADACARLVAATAEVGARLVIDLSEQFELSSTPSVNGVLAYLSEHALPPHVALVCGLVRGRVYSDLELCFVYSQDEGQIRALTLAAELTYSRAPLMTQRYYAQILNDLLDFRIEERQRFSNATAAERPRVTNPPRALQSVPAVPVCAIARAAFEDPTLVAHNLELGPSTLRLDYGENALPAPSMLRFRLFEAFARQHLSKLETDPEPEILALLSRRFGIRAEAGDSIQLGGGVAPLFASLVRACAAEAGTLLIPQGSYGYFVAAARLFNVQIEVLPTLRQHDFKLSAATLRSALERVPRAWLFLNGPAVNPTGAIYTALELSEIMAVAAEAQASLVIDTIFSGLEFPGQEVTWDLHEASLACRKPLEFALLGGLSKELAAGGLRFGYGWTNSRRLRTALSSAHRDGPPHATLCFAAKHCMQELLAPSDQTRRELFQQRRTLERRARELGAVLRECGWDVLEPRGGLFLVARPSFYLGKQLVIRKQASERQFVLQGDGVAEALFYATELLVNNPTWTGIPEYCRFVCAVDEATFNAGLAALRTFRSLFPS